MTAIMPFLVGERDSASPLLLQVIGSTLIELIKKGESQGKNHVNRRLTRFHGLRPPSIPLPDYLKRIGQFSGCSNEAFVLMLIYIDRLVTKKHMPFDSLNVHRLVITATLLAAKFFDDHYLDNAHYSTVGGLPRNEINELELEMLFMLGFNLFVTSENYDTYYNTLIGMASAQRLPVMIPSFDRRNIEAESPETESQDCTPSPTNRLQSVQHFSHQEQPQYFQYVQQQKHLQYSEQIPDQKSQPLPSQRQIYAHNQNELPHHLQHPCLQNHRQSIHDDNLNCMEGYTGDIVEHHSNDGYCNPDMPAHLYGRHQLLGYQQTPMMQFGTPQHVRHPQPRVQKKERVVSQASLA